MLVKQRIYEFFSSVQLLSCAWLFVTLWTTARQASLSITNCRSLTKPMSIDLVMTSNHLILCPPLHHLPSILPSIRVFSNKSNLRMRWPKYWSFSFSISPSKEHPGLISFRMDWLDLLAVQGTLKSLLQHHSSKHQFLGVHWKDWCWSWNSSTLATWCKELTHWKRPWCWERLKAEGERDDRGWDGWMASPTQWTWVWVDSRSWWWTGRPGVLQFMVSQRVGHN